MREIDMDIEIKETKEINIEKIIKLYKANKWSSAEKPDLLYKALMNSDSLITAWDGNRLVGLGNAISDGYLVVYYPHLLVHPDYQGKGIGKMIVDKFQNKYGNFHQQLLTADGKAIDFYRKCGFEKAGSTQSMWIYQGDEHD
jgi:GNAT superfamily N-acetyltransferase